MSKLNIPRSIQEIIEVYIRSGFRPFTYSDLAKKMKLETNTLVQRINRNPEYFIIKDIRPKIIKLDIENEQIHCYRYDNTCQICQKQFNPNHLMTRYKDPYLKNKENWENVIICCENCKDENLLKKLTYGTTQKSLDEKGTIWEYLKIEIRERREEINPYRGLYNQEKEKTDRKYEYFYEFNRNDGRGWFHVVDKDNKRCHDFTDILNYFGSKGWELINYKTPQIFENYDEIGNYECIFKRKKKKEIGGNK